MRIQHNLSAMSANGNIKANTRKSVKTTEKLSSGYQINRAVDDAAGLAISEKMRRMIRGLSQASDNCQDGISMVQTAEGALNEVHAMLQRLNELAVQSANETNNTNGTGGVNGGNTASVIDLDEPQQKAPVMRMMSLRSVAPVAETSIQVEDFTLTGTDLKAGEDYSYSDHTLTILSDKEITISGRTDSRIIIQDSVTANITLHNLDIVITEQSTGSLSAVGSTYGAGIGGGWQGDGGNITINGGTVTAIGGATQGGGAGIGGGAEGGAEGNIVINGGTVTAIGGGDSDYCIAIGGSSKTWGGEEHGSFFTGTDGTATIIVEGDTSQKVNWSGIVDGVVYPPLTGDVSINLNDISGTLEITDTGYKVGGLEYLHEGNILVSELLEVQGNIAGNVSNTSAAQVKGSGYTIAGGTYGTDFILTDNTLTVLKGTALTLEGTGTTTNDRVKIKGGITANLTVKM